METWPLLFNFRELYIPYYERQVFSLQVKAPDRYSGEVDPNSTTLSLNFREIYISYYEKKGTNSNFKEMICVFESYYGALKSTEGRFRRKILTATLYALLGLKNVYVSWNGIFSLSIYKFAKFSRGIMGGTECVPLFNFQYARVAQLVE